MNFNQFNRFSHPMTETSGKTVKLELYTFLTTDLFRVLGKSVFTKLLDSFSSLPSKIQVPKFPRKDVPH